MEDDLDERALDISHWGPVERAVLFKYSDDAQKVCGEIVSMHIRPNQGFEAEILVKAGNITYQGTVYCGWCREGKGKTEYQFLKEPEEVTRLKAQMKRKKREAVLAKLKEEEGIGDVEEDDGFLGDLETKARKLAMGGKRKGSSKVSAVEDSRLPKDSGTESE